MQYLAVDLDYLAKLQAKQLEYAPRKKAGTRTFASRFPAVLFDYDLGAVDNLFYSLFIPFVRLGLYHKEMSAVVMKAERVLAGLGVDRGGTAQGTVSGGGEGFIVCVRTVGGKQDEHRVHDERPFFEP